MRYRICEAKHAGALQNDVNRLLLEGWEPIGGLSVTYSQTSGNWWYYQAMIHMELDPISEEAEET